MNLRKVFTNAMSFADDHQRQILIGLELAGIVTTMVLTWKASPKCEKIITKQKASAKALDAKENLTEEQYKQAKKEITLNTFKEIAPIVAPPLIMGGLTIGCAIGGYNASTRQIAALTAAYNLAKDSLSDYKSKALPLIGEKKVGQIQDDVNADKVMASPPRNQIINTGNGTTLCYDPLSGRYFYSSPEAIRKSFNIINKQVMDEYYVSLNEAYDQLDLDDIELGDMVGFNVDDGLIDIDHLFSSTLYNDIPVLVLNYEVSPKYTEHRGAMFR